MEGLVCRVLLLRGEGVELSGSGAFEQRTELSLANQVTSSMPMMVARAERKLLKPKGIERLCGFGDGSSNMTSYTSCPTTPERELAGHEQLVTLEEPSRCRSPSGGKCTGGTTPPSAKTCGGNPVSTQTQAYFVGVRIPANLCALSEWQGYANSQAEATGCAQAAFPGYNVLPNQNYSYYSYAQYSPIGPCAPVQVPAFSQSDADRCAWSTCVNCTNVAGGQCP